MSSSTSTRWTGAVLLTSMVLIGGFILALLGVWLVIEGPAADVKLVFLGQELTSTNVGLAITFLGASLVAFGFWRGSRYFGHGARLENVHGSGVAKGAMVEALDEKGAEVLTHPPAHRPGRLHSDPTPVSATRSGRLGAQFTSVRRIRETEHSAIDEMERGGRRWVIKRTRKDLCDLSALGALAGCKIIAREVGMTVTLLTPNEISEEEGAVVELYEYVAGQPLDQLIRANKYNLKGEFLGRIYAGALSAINTLHEFGVLHRDLSPGNFLLTASGDLYIMDPSFCCAIDGPQVPVRSRYFTPPEQVRGEACPQSDWYSLAATVFFLANGRPPHQDSEEFFEGIASIDLGVYGYTQVGGECQLFDSLLDPDVSRRPTSYSDVVPREVSNAVVDGAHGVLDCGEDRWLILRPQDYDLVSKSEAVRIFQDLLDRQENRSHEICWSQLPNKLEADLRAALRGENPWRK